MNIEKFKDLSNLNTFGVRIIADYYAAVTSEEELEEALNFASLKNIEMKNYEVCLDFIFTKFEFF